MFVCVQNSICGWKKNKKIFVANFENYLKKFLFRQKFYFSKMYENYMTSIFSIHLMYGNIWQAFWVYGGQPC